MDQLFDPTKVVLNEKGILLGIQSENIPYEVNKDGSYCIVYCGRNCGTIIKIQMKFPWYLVFQLQRIQTGAIWLRSISWNFLKWMERGIRHLLCTVI